MERRPCRGGPSAQPLAALVVALRAANVAAQYYTIAKVVPTPHLVARIPVLPPRQYGGGVVAKVTAIYEVNTLDFQTMMDTVRERAAMALEGVPLQYLEVEDFRWLTVGAMCASKALRCRGPDGGGPGRLAPGVGGALPRAYQGSLAGVDPRFCEAASGAASPDSPIAPALPGALPKEFNPQWEEGAPDELDTLIAGIQLCVNKKNTSLMYYPVVLQNVFVTGWRDQKNANITRNKDVEGEDIKLELHVVGVIPVKWATFLNRKFIMNGSIPLPLYQPELVDKAATVTDDLNVTLPILAVRKRALPPELGGDILDEFMPVCVDPKIAAKGCVRITTTYYFHPKLTRYKLFSCIVWRKGNFTQVASDQSEYSGDQPEYNVSQGPWPFIDWVGEVEAASGGPWSQRTFPQKESVYQQECKNGNQCAQVPHAPSARHLHSAVLYTTWSFQDQAWRSLCNERPGCQEDCLTNLTCLGGESYFQENFFFRSSTFKNDDGGIVPLYTLQNKDCPRNCCGDRRLCLRVHDVLGYEVPFSSEMMLVFGGKSYAHVKDPGDGRLIYHSCERIPKGELRSEWQSCMEQIVGDLWRYDLVKGSWEYIKPDSATSPTTGEPVGYPLARYGHAAVVIVSVEGNDKSRKRYFMYMYGGLGPQCTGGVCNDMWKYEIPWAAQAYYPKFPDGEWVRGNQWTKLKDCPFGGRYRHSMVATSGNEYIYSFGGQVVGEFTNSFLRYRVSTDMWEDLDPFGRISLTRLLYDFRGAQVIRQVPLEEYDRDIDVDCANAWRSDGKWSHCGVCPHCRLTTGTREKGSTLPEERGDAVITSFLDPAPGAVDDAIAIFGGYRTTWGTLRDPDAECGARPTTTSTTAAAFVPMEDIVLTDPPSTSAAASTTTFSEKSGLSLEGTFSPLGPTELTTTTATFLWTSTVTTTERLNVETFTSTTSTTSATRTSTSSTSTTTVSITMTGSTTLAGTTSTAVRPLTMPPVVAGSDTKPFNFSTGTSSGSGKDSQSRAGPEVCTFKYYFDDLWLYEATVNQFAAHATAGIRPEARRGHQMIARRARTNDTQLVLFGGHRQDRAMKDMWVLNVLRSGEDRRWAQIDAYMEGQQPPPMSYHTMLYSERLDVMVVFGGLHWEETDLDRSDALRNVDRRCLKKAQGMIDEEAGKSEAAFLRGLRRACEDVQFCCELANQTVPPVYFQATRIRTDTGALNLTAISLMCRKECEAKAFFPEFYPIMSEGIWVFKTDLCVANCSGHGSCDMSQCVCEPEWYGIDCSQKRCPGSPCYTDPAMKEQFCVDCSTHGRCINGECQCFPGWGFEDCSAVLCEGNCSSTPLETRGICVEDFPVHQCVCLGRWSGSKCNDLLCLNGCSGRGTCGVDGACTCDAGFHGEDCSLWALTIQ